MADEITISASMKFTKGNYSVNVSKGGLQIDVTGTAYQDKIQTIGTSEEAIDLGDVGAGGWCFLENMDTTNYIEIRPATGAADLIKLLAGEIAMFRLTGDAVPFAIADTGACDLRVVLIDL
jgi:hypothetical protein